MLDERGRIHVGCNVENASYGLTVCAERNAVAAAVAAGAARIRAVAVFDRRTAATPCGACRQVLAELGAAGPTIRWPRRSGGPRRLTLHAIVAEAFVYRNPARCRRPARRRSRARRNRA